MKKKSLLILLIILLISFMFLFRDNNKKNVIKDLTFNQIEDKKTPLNYKKEYTFIIKELSGNNTLEFNIINHYVNVYIDNLLVYELKEDINNETLVKIPLDKKDINKKVKIILTPLNERKNDNNLDLKIK